jgi:hypothetical protein
MPSLREIQSRFVASLDDPASEDVADWVVMDGVNAAERVSIYRNNVQLSFVKALALEFPVIERLVGQTYFAQLAHEFMCLHPSRNGDLHFVGMPFPDFLRERFEDSRYRYLSQVARLEWARQEVIVAADASPMELAPLKAVEPQDYCRLRFVMHPACRLVRSEYPVLKIWWANQDDSDSTELIDLDGGAELVVVHRRVSVTEMFALPVGQFVLLEALGARQPLGDAVDLAVSSDGCFDLGEALSQFVTLGIFLSAFVGDIESSGVPQ